MTQTNNQFRSEQRADVKSAGRESMRSATIPKRVVPVKTLYMELSVRRDFFDDESNVGRTEHHPEWYIG